MDVYTEAETLNNLIGLETYIIMVSGDLVRHGNARVKQTRRKEKGRVRIFAGFQAEVIA